MGSTGWQGRHPAQVLSKARQCSMGKGRYPIDSLSPRSQAARRAAKKTAQRVYRATAKGKKTVQRGNAGRISVGGGARVRAGGRGRKVRYSAVQLAWHSMQHGKRSAASQSFKAGQAAAGDLMPAEAVLAAEVLQLEVVVRGTWRWVHLRVGTKGGTPLHVCGWGLRPPEA